MKKNKEKKVKQSYGIYGLMLIVTVLVLVTYALFNYTKNDVLNNERPGNINYSIAPSDTVKLVNVNPISGDYLEDELNNTSSVTVIIKGKTNYDEEIEYLVDITDVNNEINGKKVPISYQASAYELGMESENYFVDKNENETLYQLNESGLISNDGVIALGHIKKGEEEFDGVIVITSYIDINKIGVFGEENHGEEELPSNQITFTPEEWDEIITKGVSFKVRVTIKNSI